MISDLGTHTHVFLGTQCSIHLLIQSVTEVAYSSGLAADSLNIKVVAKHFIRFLGKLHCTSFSPDPPAAVSACKQELEAWPGSSDLLKCGQGMEQYAFFMVAYHWSRVLDRRRAKRILTAHS